MSETFYLIDTLVLLAAAVLAVPLFQLLRLGAVLGFLAGGALVGPWGLGFIDQVEEIRHLAEFGVVFLLFIIGIELKPSRLWIMRRSVFGLGTAQVLLTGLIITGLALAFGVPQRTALILGFGLALSSTAFGLQILAEKGELRSAYGRSAFSILLLQDLAVVPLLALVPLLAQQDLTLTQDLELALLETLVILIGVLVVGRFLARPLLDLVAKRRTPEVFVATAVLLVLGTAWLTDRAGLSMALGAFLAGILLSDSRYRHQIMADIQPFRGMLLGLFFMTVGMTIDFGLLIREGMLVVGLVGGLLLLKAVLIWALCRITGRSHQESIRVALLLPQGGEFGFVLFGLAFGLGVMPNDLYQLLVLVVAMSMALTPLLVKLSPWLGRSPAATEQEPPRAEPIPAARDHVIIAGFGRFGQRVANILSRAGVPYQALDINPSRVEDARAQGFNVYDGDASRIDVLRAAGAAQAALVVFATDRMQLAAQGIAALREAYPELPIYTRATDLRVGRRLLAMGATRAIPEALEASLQLATEVLSVAQVPAEKALRLIDENRQQEYGRLAKTAHACQTQRFSDILLVLDTQPESPRLFDRIASLAQVHRARLTVMDVLEELPELAKGPRPAASDGGIAEVRQVLTRMIAPLAERLALEVETLVLTGTPHTEIIREVIQGDRDLVVKTAGPSSRIIGRMSGGTDIQLLRNCPCPLWLVRPSRPGPHRRILAAVDVERQVVGAHTKARHELNRRVIEYAVGLALTEVAELHLVHVWQAYGEEVLRSGRSPFPQWDTDAYVKGEEQKHLASLHALLNEVGADLGSTTMEGLKPQIHLVNGEPADELLRLARTLEVDMVVMGTSSRRGIASLIMGNTAETMFRSLDCSVFVVKPADFVTPVSMEK